MHVFIVILYVIMFFVIILTFAAQIKMNQRVEENRSRVQSLEENYIDSCATMCKRVEQMELTIDYLQSQANQPQEENKETKKKK